MKDMYVRKDGFGHVDIVKVNYENGTYKMVSLINDKLIGESEHDVSFEFLSSEQFEFTLTINGFE